MFFLQPLLQIRSHSRQTQPPTLQFKPQRISNLHFHPSRINPLTTDHNSQCMSVTDNLSFVLNRRPNLKFNCKLLFYLFISFKILIPNFPVSSSIMECQLNDPNITIPMLLSKIISMIPTQHFVIACAVLIFIVLYNFLEFHLIGDALKGFRGDRVRLTFNSSSEIYEGVASRCRSLHGRYLVTPWLSSPHFQTTFLNFFGRPPSFHYSRQLYKVQDGGTIALDWLLASNAEGGSYDASRVISKEDKTPLVIVVPGLTSDSVSPYLKHLVYGMAKQGWNVVVSNHRGLGGISITSDRFYNAGWTDDVREVINYLHKEYPEAPLFAVGTSIGANILVKYLGEEGENTPLAGAASICSPWDLVVCDRFINRKLVQRLYDRALAFGLKGYAQLHQAILTRLANWDGISSSRTVRDFDNHATCIVAKFETVDTYYRHCSSVSFVSGVSVPLLCISAIDDPVCTSEAIPWDECRANKKIVLATLPHGGHLAFFQGITARKLWWVGAVGEFLAALYTSPYMHGQQQIENTGVHYSIESDIDKSPYVNLMDDGLVTALITDTSNNNGATSINTQTTRDPKPGTSIIDQNVSGNNEDNAMTQVQTTHEDRISKIFSDMTSQVKRSMNRVSRQSGISVWLLAYVAIVTSWPLLGSFLGFFKRKKLLGVAKAAAFSR